ncbi:hypothetical protein L0Y34_01765 [Candidatus Parcubacteria bacterium]|nr:hypothetical protein [Candidatus Parcubacteria bacterium]
MEGGTTGPIHFLNLEYFFNLLYGARVDVDGSAGTLPQATFLEAFAEWFSHAWGVLGVASLFFVIIGLCVLMYATVRMIQIKKREDEEKYNTVSPAVAEKQKDHARWAHIRTLVESAQENDWRQAVIEADIMLDEVLTQAGYPGATVGEKLTVAQFETLNDAWEAHKIRNEIAHQGSAYHLDDNVAYRTIQKYERVFKEFGEI